MVSKETKYDYCEAWESMTDEENVLYLLYDPRINRFIDDFGAIRDDIFRFITPGQVMLFKKNKNKFLTPDITHSFLVELVYPHEY